MGNVITIPKEIAKKGDLVLIPRADYEAFLKLAKRKIWEKRDADEAIKIFKEERKKKKLIAIESLAELIKIY